MKAFYGILVCAMKRNLYLGWKIKIKYVINNVHKPGRLNIFYLLTEWKKNAPFTFSRTMNCTKLDKVIRYIDTFIGIWNKRRRRRIGNIALLNVWGNKIIGIAFTLFNMNLGYNFLYDIYLTFNLISVFKNIC